MNIPTVCVIIDTACDDVLTSIAFFADKVHLKSEELTLCNCDYHLVLKGTETLQCKNKNYATYVKSKMTEEAYFVPIILTGTKEGILEKRITRCTCSAKFEISDDKIIMSNMYIETANVENQPFGEVRRLIANDKREEAMKLLSINDKSEREIDAMTLYLKSLCETDDSGKSAYLCMAATIANSMLKRVILNILARRIMDRKLVTWSRHIVWDIIQMNNKVDKWINVNDLYFLDVDLNRDRLAHILAYYEKKPEEGIKICDHLIIDFPIPNGVKQLAVNNQKFYIKPIKSDIIIIDPECDQYYVATNPSIVKRSGGYTILCRTVNYDYIKNKGWIPRDGGKVIRTKNLLLDCDEQFNIVKSRRIELHPDLKYKKGKVHPLIFGHEDARIFRRGEELWYTYTALDTNPLGRHQIALCKLNEDASVVKLVPLLHKNQNVQKNWLPFALDGKINVIYSYAPMTVFTVNEDTGQCRKFEGFRGLQTKIFRGSTGPIEYPSPSGEKGWLLMVHQTTADRVYTQRFIWLDSNFIMKVVSTAFYFKKVGVELPLSAIESTDGKQIIVSFGVDDKTANIARIDRSVVNEYLWKSGYMI